MNRIVEYDVMVVKGLSELCRAVQNAITTRGLQPLGAPFVLKPGWHAQAMVKYERVTT